MTFEQATIDNTTDFAGFLITLAQLTLPRDRRHSIRSLTTGTSVSSEAALIIQVISGWSQYEIAEDGATAVNFGGTHTNDGWRTGLNITLDESPSCDWHQHFSLNAVHTIGPKSEGLSREDARLRAEHFGAVEQVIAALETAVKALRINKTVVTSAVPQGD